MSKLDFSNLYSIIENLKIREENIKVLLENQNLTIFHTRAYYEGKLDAYSEIILTLKLYQKYKKAEN